MNTTMKSKVLQIISAVFITLAVWGSGIATAGCWNTAELIEFSNGVPILNILYPFVLILFAGICGQFCKKKDKKYFFISAMVMLALPILSYPIFMLFFMLPYPLSLIGYPFLLLASLPSSIAVGVERGIGNLFHLPIYEVPFPIGILAWILFAASVAVCVIVYKKTKD